MCICSDSGKTGNYKFSVVALGKLDAQKYIVNRDGYIYDGKLNSRLYKLCGATSRNDNIVIFMCKLHCYITAGEQIAGLDRKSNVIARLCYIGKYVSHALVRGDCKNLGFLHIFLLMGFVNVKWLF